MTTMYPPAEQPTDFTDATVAATVHAQRHNNNGAAINDIVAVLGPNPAGPNGTIDARLADQDTRLGQVEAITTPSVNPMPASYLIASRGGALEGPEETLEASRAVLAARSAAMIHISVRPTRDNALHVIVDGTLSRTTNKTATIDQLTAAQMAAARITPATFHRVEGYPTLPIPTLEQYLDEFGGRIVLSIDLPAGVTVDRPGHYGRIVAMLVRRGLLGSTFVTSTVPEDVPTIAGLGARPILYATGDAPVVGATPHATYIAQGAHMFAIHANASDAAITEAVAAGYPAGVASRTGDSNTRYGRDRLWALGIRGIFTDVPAYLASNTGSATDSLKVGAWGAGYVPSRGASNPILRAGGIIELTDRTSPATVLNIGELSPVPASGYTVSGMMRITAALSGPNTGLYIHLGDRDNPYDPTDTDILHNGYTARYSPGGSIAAQRNTRGAAALGFSGLAAAPALAAGVWRPFAFRINSTSVIVSEPGFTGATAGQTVADATHRYPWFLQIAARAHTGGAWQVKDLTVAP